MKSLTKSLILGALMVPTTTYSMEAPEKTFQSGQPEANHLQFDLYFDSSKQELTDEILGKYIQENPNKTSLRLNIIYLTEKGLRLLEQLSTLEVLLLECTYSDTVESLKIDAANEFRKTYYPDRIKLCREVLLEIKNEFETCENKDHREFIIGSFDKRLAACKKVINSLLAINKYESDIDKKNKHHQLYTDALKKSDECLFDESIELLFKELVNDIAKIDGEWIHEYGDNPYFMYINQSESLIDSLLHNLDNQQKRCDDPYWMSGIRPHEYERKKEKANREEWLEGMPHNQCKYYLVDYLTKQAEEKFGDSFWGDKKKPLKRYKQKLREMVSAKYSTTLTPDEMKEHFPIPPEYSIGKKQSIIESDDGIWAYIWREKELRKLASLDFAFISGMPQYKNERLCNFIHFYEVVQQPQTLLSYQKLWDQLKLKSNNFWNNEPQGPIHNEFIKPKFKEIKEFQKDLIKKQRDVLGTCIHDIVMKNPKLRHLMVPELNQADFLGKDVYYATDWKLPALQSYANLLDSCNPNKLKNDLNLILHSTDEERLNHRRADEEELNLFRAYEERAKQDTTPTSDQVEEVVEESDEDQKSNAKSIHPLTKNLAVMEITHPYVTKRRIPPVQESSSSITVSLKSDDLSESINYIEGFFGVFNKIDKLIINMTFDWEKYKKHHHPPLRSDIPFGLQKSIDELVERGKIGSYEILTTDLETLGNEKKLGLLSY